MTININKKVNRHCLFQFEKRKNYLNGDSVFFLCNSAEGFENCQLLLLLGLVPLFKLQSPGQDPFDEQFGRQTVAGLNCPEFSDAFRFGVRVGAVDVRCDPRSSVTNDVHLKTK